MSDYSVTEHEHGVIIDGRVRASIMVELMREYEERGYDLADQRLADHYDATAVLTNEDESRQWRNQLGLEVDDG